MPRRKSKKPSDEKNLHTWSAKFACAFRGLSCGAAGQTSFLVHFPAATVAIAFGWWLGVGLAEWLAIVVCITIVLSAEYFNSAIEHLARAITREHHPEIRDALDTASAAVLVAAMGASVVAVVILVQHVG